MLMPVMQVGIMWVLVHQPRVAVRMAVRLARRIIRSMRVLVMLDTRRPEFFQAQGINVTF